MLPCLEGEGCDLLINRSGWTCTQPGGRVKTTTVRARPLWGGGGCTPARTGAPGPAPYPAPQGGQHVPRRPRPIVWPLSVGGQAAWQPRFMGTHTPTAVMEEGRPVSTETPEPADGRLLRCPPTQSQRPFKGKELGAQGALVQAAPPARYRTAAAMLSSVRGSKAGTPAASVRARGAVPPRGPEAPAGSAAGTSAGAQRGRPGTFCRSDARSPEASQACGRLGSQLGALAGSRTSETHTEASCPRVPRPCSPVLVQHAAAVPLAPPATCLPPPGVPGPPGADPSRVPCACCSRDKQTSGPLGLPSPAPRDPGGQCRAARWGERREGGLEERGQ